MNKPTPNEVLLMLREMLVDGEDQTFGKGLPFLDGSIEACSADVGAQRCFHSKAVRTAETPGEHRRCKKVRVGTAEERTTGSTQVQAVRICQGSPGELPETEEEVNNG